MMNSRPLTIFTLAALVATLATGCGLSTSVVHLTSYKDAYFPESYDLRLSTCAFEADDAGDLHIVGQADAAQSPTDLPLSQYLHVHVYWKPRPGRTYANRTTTNAVLRYLVVSENGTALYTGTGFAYPRRRDQGDRMDIDLETGRLTLAWRAGELPDFLGKASITAELNAANDPTTTAAILREMELLSKR